MADLNVSVADTTTTSENIGYYSDTVNTAEYVVVYIVHPIPSVSDTTTTSENIQVEMDYGLAVGDSTTTSENVSLLISGGVDSINAADTTTTGENISLLITTLYVSVSDTTTTSENLGTELISYVAVSDLTTTSEYQAFFNTTLDIDVGDSISGGNLGANIIFLTDGRVAVKLSGNVYLPL